MLSGRWRVCLLPAETSIPSDPLPFVAQLPPDWEDWRATDGTPAGTPFLLDPDWSYDVALNAFFRSAEMLGSAHTTQVGYARNLAAFLTFLWTARDQRCWREATADDHLAYLAWRRYDERGPRVADVTWDREVAAVNRFYSWQIAEHNVAVNPIPQQQRRQMRPGRWGLRGGEGAERPATYSHGAARERIEWLPAAYYRRWRDVGLRGYTADGLPDPRFRGRWAARNAVFADLMVRTGLRLSEQAGLSVVEVPTDRGITGYPRFWLPPALAKGGSARWVYVPASVITELVSYVEIDRAAVIDAARERGRYQAIRRPLVVDDPARPTVVRTAGGGRAKLAQLTAADRRRLLVDGPRGLEPAALWLGEAGLPLTVSSWKSVFRDADRRCAARGVALRAHPHALRHTFAVITLEQLQRGHIAALGELSPEQRGHYSRIFGDPLDWVRRRLGHRSVETTMIYLHALEELEMATRMALVPDDWQTPHDTRDDDPPADHPADGDDSDHASRGEHADRGEHAGTGKTMVAAQ